MYKDEQRYESDNHVVQEALDTPLKIKFLSPDVSISDAYVVSYEMLCNSLGAITFPISIDVGTAEDIRKIYGLECLLYSLKEYLEHISTKKRIDASVKLRQAKSIKCEMPIGSVVKLKSGGPKMTVISHKNDKVWCNFFLDNREMQTNEFVYETLDHVKSDNLTSS